MSLNRFDLKSCPGKGKGVFTAIAFKAGDTVMTGIVMEVLRSNNSHASQIAEDQYVLFGGLVSKVNHSCDPNCGIHLNDMGGHDFIALKDICKDEEVTFDYAMENFTIDHFPNKCMCGSRNCRISITGWKDLPNNKRSEYKDFAAPYLFELGAGVKKTEEYDEW